MQETFGRVGDFEHEMTRVRACKHGDIVYERVRAGTATADVRWKKWRVVRADGSHATVVNPDTESGHRKIPLGDLHMPKTPPASQAPSRPVVAAVSSIVPKAAPSVAPPNEPRARAGDSEYDNWLSMGRQLVSGVAEEERTLTEQQTKLQRDLENFDANHLRAIKDLEDELLAAKRSHKEDRALVETRLEAIATKLSRIVDRRKNLEMLLSESAKG